MRPQEQRIAIAEACGWKFHRTAKKGGRGIELVQIVKPDGTNAHPWPCVADSGVFGNLPDYPSDLNAMHEAEKLLSGNEGVSYRLILSANSGKRDAKYPTVESAMCHATASERADAFVEILKRRDA